MTATTLRLQQAVLAAALAVPALLFAMAAWWNCGEVLQEGAETVQRTAAVMQEQAAKVLDSADLILARVAEHLRDMDAARIAAPETSAFLRATERALDQVVSIWVTDAEGRVRAGSGPWDPAASIADRDFFQAHRERPDAGAYVSAAFVGRATGIASFAISRRRSKATGAFAGTIHVALSPDYFARFYAEAAPPFRHVAGMLRADGAILVREPGPAAEQERLEAGSALMRQIAAGSRRGLLTGRLDTEGGPRVCAYAQVGNWPVYVFFGADTAALLQRWRTNLFAYGMVAAAAALILLLVALLALRQARAAMAAEAALRRAVVERAAAEARQAAEARFRGVFESRAIGMAIFDAVTGETLAANDRLLEMTGSSRAQFEAGPWDLLGTTPPGQRALDERARAEARARGWWDPYETEFLRPDGSRLPVRLSTAPLPGSSGRVVVLVQDIAEQREAERRRDLLMREVDHRAKNALATTRAALRLTRAPDIESFVREVDGRIGALAQALTLLSNTQWHGAALEALLRGELAPFLCARQGEPRAVLQGPPVTIAATAVQPLAMAIHELATNAMKYGALSQPNGRLLLDWGWAGPAMETLTLTWRERGGPAVEAPPGNCGFGTRVLQGTVTRQLGGRLELCWDPEGLVGRIELPVARVVAAAAVPDPIAL
ncbi:HWE histidine kinase domain-containing protein [Roseicella frigidaeris]|uniref:HWE histidine kinase domain-containing protein n=1 Tax=Roseicella frigidaeris TaxID=2230885 RepID=UPI00140246EA|nr:HWE histidine kinase domain-containing protein [Roseicella frigidaeris]